MSDLIKYYKKIHDELKQDISKCNFSIALTSDIWNGKNKEYYISAIAHYIDENWKIQKRIIGFKLIDIDHSAQGIVKKMLDIVTDLNIANHIISITFDNMAVNTKSMELLEISLSSYICGFLLHQRCVCHSINLIVKLGMKQLMSLIETICECLSYLASSNSRRRSFKSFCIANGLAYKQSELDMLIRWNSTYYMLVQALSYKTDLNILCNTEMEVLVLTNEHWIVVEIFVQFLETFKNEMQELSSVYYPTTLFALLQIFLIGKDLADNKSQVPLKNV